MASFRALDCHTNTQTSGETHAVFVNDYSSTAAPQILEKMQQLGNEHNPGYGADKYCDSAATKIRKACDDPEANIWFLVGGTQTNQTVLSAITPQYAGVVCASNGHINVHEAGAIEATGHKVLASPAQRQDHRRTARRILPELRARCQPRAHGLSGRRVYFAATEYGTVYTREELAAISQVSHDHDLPLFVDGARLGDGIDG